MITCRRVISVTWPRRVSCFLRVYCLTLELKFIINYEIFPSRKPQVGHFFFLGWPSLTSLATTTSSSCGQRVKFHAPRSGFSFLLAFQPFNLRVTFVLVVCCVCWRVCFCYRFELFSQSRFESEPTAQPIAWVAADRIAPKRCPRPTSNPHRMNE